MRLQSLLIVPAILAAATAETQSTQLQPKKPAPAIQKLLDAASKTRDNSAAIEAYSKAAAAAKAASDLPGEGAAEYACGSIYDRLNEWKSAVVWYDSAAISFETAKDRLSQAEALFHAGDCSDTGQDEKQAMSFYSRAIQLFQTLGDVPGQVRTLNGIAGVQTSPDASQKSLNEAVADYERAIALARKGGDRSGEALVLGNLAVADSYLKLNDQARKCLDGAQALEKGLGDSAEKASTLISIGQSYNGMNLNDQALTCLNDAWQILTGEPQELRRLGDLSALSSAFSALGKSFLESENESNAIDLFEQAVKAGKWAHDPEAELTALIGFGKLYQGLGQFDKALGYYDQALSVAKSNDERAELLTFKGDVYRELKQPQLTLKLYEETLVLVKKLGATKDEATMLSNIGVAYDDLGMEQKALEFDYKALSAKRAIPDLEGAAVALSNIGWVYSNLGQKEKALDYFQQALGIMRDEKKPLGEAISLSNIGTIYDDGGDKDKAIGFFNQALTIFMKEHDRVDQYETLNRVGNVLLNLGERDKSLVYNASALDYFSAALPIQRAAGDRRSEASTLTRLGKAHLGLGDVRDALELFCQALPIERDVSDRKEEAVTLDGFGQAAIDGGLPNIAIAFLKAAVNLRLDLLRDVAGLDSNSVETYEGQARQSCTRLAAELAKQGRLREEEETKKLLVDETIVSRGVQGAPSTRLSLNPTESSFIRAFDTRNLKIQHLGALVADLRRLVKRTKDQDAQLIDLESKFLADAKDLAAFVVPVAGPSGGGQADPVMSELSDPKMAHRNSAEWLASGLGETTPATSAANDQSGEMAFSDGFVGRRLGNSLVLERSLAQQTRGGGSEPNNSPDIDVSKATYYALFIGTDHYQDKNFPTLSNPIFDVENVSKTVHDFYDFQPTVLRDPTYDTISEAIKAIRKIDFKPADELLVYIAGHGFFDSDFLNTGMLILNDSKSVQDDPSERSLFPFDALRRALDNTRSPHILVMMDVCFGASFSDEMRKLQDQARGLNSSDAVVARFLKEKMGLKTRELIASGPKEVDDGHPGEGSPFAQAVLGALHNFPEIGMMTASHLWEEIEMLPPFPLMAPWENNQLSSVFVFKLKPSAGSGQSSK